MTEKSLFLKTAALAALLLGAALLLAAMIFLPAQAAEETAPGTALIFDRGQMEGLAPGDTLAYRHSRRVPEGVEVPPIAEGEIRLSVEAGEDDATRRVRVALTEGERTRRLDPFPASSGNPVLVVFLESSLRAMARATGGSPFYLRNRIKEAFWQGVEPEPLSVSLDGGEVAAERVVFRPFAADAHVEELGAFRDIQLEFVLSDAVPGRFLSLAAATAPGAEAAFREEVTLSDEVTR